MKSKYLIPHACKKYGWLLLLIAVVASIIEEFRPGFIPLPKVAVGFGDATTSIFLTLITVILFFGLLMIAFSREKNEDELISHIRLESLQVAVITNYVLLIIASLLIYGLTFLTVMFYNMFTILVIFIIRFHWVLYRNKRAAI